MKMYWSTRRHRTKLLSLLCALAIFVSLIPAVSAADIQDVLKNHTITDTVTPAGVQLNLFDYWIDSRTSTDTHTEYAKVKDSGINEGHYLKFISSGPVANGADNINQWTGSSSPRSGIVKDRLSGGYPVLTSGKAYGTNQTETTEEQSLAYLFDKSDEDGTYGSTTSYKKTFWDVAGLLRVGKDGYYYYNANKKNVGPNQYENANYAYFDEQKNAFTLYDNWAVQAGGGSDVQGQFFPFTDPKTVFTPDGNNALTQASIDSGNDAIHHYFGMTMTTRFVQRYGGKTSDKHDAGAMTFQFAGDDDVWIFIDGVLVADLGGIHNQATTTIDFATGAITINSPDQKGYSTTDLKTVMRKYYGEDSYWAEGKNTFADNTYHTLKLFYLERGGTNSNLAMKFNLAYVPETDGIKVDQNGTLLPGVQFDLYAATRTGNGDGTYKYTKASEKPIGSGTTDEDGRFVLTNADDIAVSLNDLNKRGIQYLILEERNENRTGYRHDDSIYLVLQSNDADTDTVLLNDENHRWTTGTYAALKGSVATSPDITLSDTNETINLDNDGGKLFAVIMRRMSNVGVSVPVSGKDEWGVVTGSALSGWQVTGRESGGRYIPAVIEALKDNAVANGNAVVFTPAANGSYMAELKNCPGDLRNYYYWSNNADTAYTVAFYYTEESDLSRANERNTHWVDGKDFDRQFAATIYIPNVKHYLNVQKVDETGNAVPEATFSLYKKDDLTVSGGAWDYAEGKSEQDAYDTVTTDENGKAQFPSKGHVLAEGEYYLVEDSAPVGYKVNATAVPVIVDDTHGVMADAGTNDDGVAVTVAEGHLVPTMTPFATVDDIDRTLTNITTTRMEAPSSSMEAPSSSGWDPALVEKTEQTVELKLDTKSFKKDHPVQTLRYIPVDKENESLSWRTETGWLWFHIEQTPFDKNDENDTDAKLKTDLGDRDLTRLFTGETTVVVTDTRVGSLDIRKTVTDLTGAATNLPDRYALEIALNDNAYNGEVSYTSKVGNAAAQTGKLHFTGGKKTYYNIQPDETLTLLDLPFGTTWSVKETANLPAANWRTTVNGQTGKEASGKIEKAGQRATVAIVNSYDEYNKYTGTLTVTKKVETASNSTAPDANQTFPIQITLKNADNTAYTGTIGNLIFDEEGTTWNAKNGDSLTLTLPIGTTWTVREGTLTNAERWDTTVSASTGATVLDLVASGTISTTGSAVNITNTYDYAATPTKAEATIKVSKEYAKGEGKTAYTGDVSFTLTRDPSNSAGDPLANSSPMTISITGKASKSFETLEFTKAGTYTYTVNEVNEGVEDMTYSATVYTVTFNVARGTGNDRNKLVATPTYTVVEKPGAASNSYPYTDTTGLLFTNTYNPGSSEEQDKGSLSIHKTLENPKNATTGLPKNYEIKITLSHYDGISSSSQIGSSEPQSVTLTFDANGIATYHIQAGETLTLSDLPVGTQWTVTETAQLDSKYWRTAYKVNGQDATTVSDKISAANETDAVIITNTYDPNGGEIVPGDTGSLTIYKTVGDGIDMRLSFGFSVLLTYQNQKTETRTLTVPANGSVTISDLPVGTLYAVTETTTGYTVTATNATGRIPVGGTTAAFHNALTGGGDVPGPGPGPIPGGDDGGTPALNRRDHYAYIIGYPDGNVHPQGNITRAEVATIFFRLLRDPVRTQYWSQTNSYSDVAGDKWYNNAISTLSNMGIICGYPDGTFRPGAPITRAELTKIAASFFADPRVAREYDGRFSDVKGSEWYIAYLMKAIEEALIYGYPDGTFGPNRPITRAETCAIVNRTLGRKPNKDHLLPESDMINWPDNLRPLAWYYAHMQEATNSHDYRWISIGSEACEQWTAKLAERNWAALERAWSHANSAPGGEVMQ